MNRSMTTSRGQQIISTARRALPLMDTMQREEAERLLAELERTPNADALETLEDFTARAAGAFETDMEPVRAAIVEALQSGSESALHDLRAMLPALLEKVNAAPALADLLAHQLGAAFLAGFRDPTADSTANAFNNAEPRDEMGKWEAVEGAQTHPLNAIEKASLGDTIERLSREKKMGEELYARHGHKPPETLKELSAVPERIRKEWHGLTGDHIPPAPKITGMMLRDAMELRADNDAVRFLQFAEAKHLPEKADALPLTGSERAAFKSGDFETRRRLRGIAWKRLSARRQELWKLGAIKRIAE